MITALTASAPGKVILSGEYAVLDGAPAICMAVDRRARVTVSEVSGDIFTVTAPGFSNKAACFQISDGYIQWGDANEAFGVVDSVWRAVDMERIAAQAIELDTVVFTDSSSGSKIGIGSSAALVVGLCAALKRSIDVAAIQGIALRAHTNLQGGVGSGADIACSLYGGLIEYRKEGSSVARLAWPQSLSWRLIWTGTSASTKDKLTQLDAGISKPSRVRLAGASETMAEIWRNGDAVEIIGGYRDYCERLHEFSVDHDLGIFDAGHDELWQAAKAMDLIYKPCGAGGGDVGIVIGTDEVALEQFARNLASGQSVLDARFSETGVRIEKSEAA
jgi:phosphomevalonate kinase